jgi:hypothetical protein
MGRIKDVLIPSTALLVGLAGGTTAGVAIGRATAPRPSSEMSGASSYSQGFDNDNGQQSRARGFIPGLMGYSGAAGPVIVPDITAGSRFNYANINCGPGKSSFTELIPPTVYPLKLNVSVTPGKSSMGSVAGYEVEVIKDGKVSAVRRSTTLTLSANGTRAVCLDRNAGRG